MSCCELPGETRSGLWSNPKTIWVALAFFTFFLAVFSTGSLTADAVAKPGYLMFASVVAMALFAAPVAHREWAFGRDSNAVLVVLGWLVATVVFVRAFAEFSRLDVVTIGLPRPLLALLGVASTVMAFRASNARWPSAPRGDKAWRTQLSALLSRYYSWPDEAVRHAVEATTASADEAGLELQEALGDPWQVAAEFVSKSPDNARPNARILLVAGLGFAALSVASFVVGGVSLYAVLVGILGAGMISLSWFLRR